MDVKHLPARKTHGQMATHSVSPKAHKLNREKVTVHYRNAPDVTKKTCPPLLPMTVTKDQKCLSLASVNSNHSISLHKNELLLGGRSQVTIDSLKQSSPNAQALENCPQKRPLKLAPLNLPEEVKEAQLHKINTMKEEAFLVKENPNQAFRTKKTISNQSMLKNPMSKVDLPNLPIEVKEAQLRKIKAMNDEVFLVGKNPNQVGKTTKTFSNQAMIRDPLSMPKFKDNTVITTLPGNKREKTFSPKFGDNDGQIQDGALKETTRSFTDSQSIKCNTHPDRPLVGQAGQSSSMGHKEKKPKSQGPDLRWPPFSSSLKGL
ncbi:uncharacterized protein PAF06_011710 [Gastrophryne carolinensis]